jgi:hypothetical protein
LQGAPDGAAHQPAMARNVNARSFSHQHGENLDQTTQAMKRKQAFRR